MILRVDVGDILAALPPKYLQHQQTTQNPCHSDPDNSGEESHQCLVDSTGIEHIVNLILLGNFIIIQEN